MELPDAIYDRLGEQVFPTANSPIAPEGVTVNGQVLFLYQSGAVYDRVLELQSTGEAMSEEEYLTLSEQAGNLCAITSIKADTLGETTWRTAPDLRTMSSSESWAETASI